MNYTRFGRFIYAIGSNAEAARLSGINVAAVTVGIYTTFGVVGGLASIIEAGRLATVQPAGGNGYELLAIGAVLIGGASTFGGEGSILATLDRRAAGDDDPQRAQHPRGECILAVRRQRHGHHRRRRRRPISPAPLKGGGIKQENAAAAVPAAPIVVPPTNPDSNVQ